MLKNRSRNSSEPLLPFVAGYSISGAYSGSQGMEQVTPGKRSARSLAEHVPSPSIKQPVQHDLDGSSLVQPSPADSRGKAQQRKPGPPCLEGEPCDIGHQSPATVGSEQSPAAYPSRPSTPAQVSLSPTQQQLASLVTDSLAFNHSSLEQVHQVAHEQAISRDTGKAEAIGVAQSSPGQEVVLQLPQHPPATGVYALSVEDMDGKEVPLADYAGKVAIVVNVASSCGFTDSNYKGLQFLYDKYNAFGFTVLGFPCNAFGGQEPGSNAEIQAFARQQYGITFPLLAKVDINGPEASPVFKFLRDALPDGGGKGADTRWNFEKVLIGPDGQPIRHYDSAMDLATLEQHVYEELLKIQPHHSAT